MPTTITRGIVTITLPDEVTAHESFVEANPVKQLTNAILTMLNERDSINRVASNPTQSYTQLSGIADPEQENQLKSALNNIYSGNYVYASDINVLINYTNLLSSSTNAASYKYTMEPCEYVLNNKTIINLSDNTTKTVNICNNTGIVCANREYKSGWKITDKADNICPVCNNPLREQVVYNPSSSNISPIPNVATDELILASTFNNMRINLQLISNVLETYKSWWDNGQCARSCQVSCQQSCQLACQHCHGGTCHDQNCGGWS